MKPLISIAALCLGAFAMAAAEGQPAANEVFEKQLRGLEHEFVPLVEAMPADKFAFAPNGGEFKGVRTFSQQAMHVAFILNVVSSTILGEKNPSATGPNENGPAGIQGKDAVVKYVKDAFAYAHKAVGTLRSDGLMRQIPNPFNANAKTTVDEMVVEIFAHTFDHYGQMVVYARMNGVVPPASLPAKR